MSFDLHSQLSAAKQEGGCKALGTDDDRGWAAESQCVQQRLTWSAPPITGHGPGERTLPRSAGLCAWAL